MIRYDSMPEIIINLNPGFYLFESESGTGKTYLYNETTKLAAAGLPVLGYTYQDYLKHVDLQKLVTERKIELLVVDRFDQYMHDSQIVAAIKSVVDKAVVLVDVKSSQFPQIAIPRTVSLRLTSNSIEVGL